MGDESGNGEVDAFQPQPRHLPRAASPTRSSPRRRALPRRLRAHRRPPYRADIVFTNRHIAIYLDGCFWHGCPDHGSAPTANADYWLPKLDRIRARDQDVTRKLQDAGWTVLRFWEHEPLDSVIETIVKTIDDQRVIQVPGNGA